MSQSDRIRDALNRPGVFFMQGDQNELMRRMNTVPPGSLATKLDITSHPKLNAVNDFTFYTFRAPLINTMFQCGERVWIKGLKSEQGRKLNGKTALVLSVNLTSLRCEVVISIPPAEMNLFQDDDTFNLGRVFKRIKIENLELYVGKGPDDVSPAIKILHECHPGNPTVKPSNRGLENIAAAGTYCGQRSLCFWPQHGEKKLKKQFQFMGVPEYMFSICLPGSDCDEAVCNLCGDACDASSCGGGGRCRCKMAWYCSKECQRADWGRHKVACKLEAKRRKLMDTLHEHNKTLENLPRLNDEEPLLLWTKTNTPYDPVVEFHIWAYPEGKSGTKVDTGVVIAHRVSNEALLRGMERLSVDYEDDRAAFKTKELDRFRREAEGKPFYHQPEMVPTFYKLASPGDLFAEREEITEKEATSIIKQHGGGEDRRFTNYVDGEFVLCENFDAEMIFATEALDNPEHQLYDTILEAHGLGMLARNAVKIGNWPEWEE